MSPVRMVAERELREKLRSRTFLITNVALLVLVLAAVVIPALLADDAPEAVELAVVGGDAIATADVATQQAAAFGYELTVRAVPDEDAARALVVDEELTAALLPEGRLASLEEPPDRLQTLLDGARRLASLDGALAEAGVAPDRRSSLLAASPLEIELLSGAPTPASSEGALFIGLAIFVLYAMLIFYGQQVAQGLVQEKQSRVIEVLLAAVRPIDLLGGKLLGLGLLGLSQIVVLAVTTVVALQLTGPGEVPDVAVPTVVAGAVWFLLGYGLYATIFALTAAVVPKMEDLQTAMIAPVALLMGSLFVAQRSLADPDGTLASVAGLLPPVAPIFQPLTFARGTASLTSTAVAAVGVVATTAVLVPLAARVHAGASLALRGRISFRDALLRADG